MGMQSLSTYALTTASSPGVPLWLERGARGVVDLLHSKNQKTFRGTKPNHQAPRSLFPALRRRNATEPGKEAAGDEYSIPSFHWV